MEIKFKSICKIDGLGRIVVPAALRKMLGITKDDVLSITMTENSILLYKEKN